MYLEKINGPEDIKKVPLENLHILADEVRAAVINRISKIGGHKGPNLGIVELTLAMHYVFNSPEDKIVFDVSHQCYPHKILTGRKYGFTDDARFREVSGFTNTLESEHDQFTVGHTSTSVSLALGLAHGRDVCGGKENIIAVIGDGSLSGGEALEAIDFAGEYRHNLIIIVNDNDMSIAENHGGMYKTLRELRENNGKAKNNIFEAFGLEYRYLDEGHDMPKLVEFLKSVKDIDHPVVMHVHTIKGKGLPYAEQNKELWHGGGPFNVEDGSPRNPAPAGENLIHTLLEELLEKDPRSVILNAATPMGLGFFGEKRAELERIGRFVDVGIAEENAVAMASGIAKRGGTPVFGTFAPFFQRTYDQMSHDLCLNNNPATMLILYPGIYGSDSNTHIALCDVQMFAHIPNLIFLAPTSNSEIRGMFEYATAQKEHPVAIRIPTRPVDDRSEDKTDYSVLRSKVVKKGKGVAVIAASNMLRRALELYEALKEEGIEISVINPVFLSGVDEELLRGLENDHSLVITMEDGELDGGYGQRVAGFLGSSDIKVITLGIDKSFPTSFDPEEILDSCGMSVAKLIKTVKDYI